MTIERYNSLRRYCLSVLLGLGSVLYLLAGEGIRTAQAAEQTISPAAPAASTAAALPVTTSPATISAPPQNMFSNVPTNDTPAAGPYYFGYAWPYGDTDMQGVMGSAPLLIELYADPGCTYSSLGNQFINDLIRKTNVIAFTCEVNMLRQASNDSMIVTECTQRHGRYSYLLSRMKTTPQIVINGHSIVTGYAYKDFLKAVKLTKISPPKQLNIKNSTKKHEYFVSLQAENLGETHDYDDRYKVLLVEYKKPLVHDITEGPNEGASLEMLHAVSRMIMLPDWFGKAEDYKFNWVPSNDSEGAVLIFERKDTGLYAVGEIKLR